MTPSTVFHSIKSPDNSPLSHSALSVLFLPHWSFHLGISLEGGGGTAVLNDESIYTLTYTHTLSLPSPPIHTYIYHSVTKGRLLGREKDVSLEQI